MWIRLILAFVLPPLAVLDRPVQADRLLVTTLAMFFGTPLMGTAVALFILFAPERYEELKRRISTVVQDGILSPASASRKSHAPPTDNDRRYIRLEDGEWLEVVDTDMEERRNRLEN